MLIHVEQFLQPIPGLARSVDASQLSSVPPVALPVPLSFSFGSSVIIFRASCSSRGRRAVWTSARRPTLRVSKQSADSGPQPALGHRAITRKQVGTLTTDYELVRRPTAAMRAPARQISRLSVPLLDNQRRPLAASASCDCASTVSEVSKQLRAAQQSAYVKALGAHRAQTDLQLGKHLCASW